MSSEQVCELRGHRNLTVVQQGAEQQTTFSEGWIALIGTTPKKLQDIQELVHPDDQDEFDRNWNRAIKSHQQFDFRIRQPDGKCRWLLGDLVPVHSDFTGIIATFIDITERKTSELAFRDSCDLIDLVLNSLHAFIAYVGPDKRHLYVNQAYLDFFGQERQQILEKTVGDLVGTAYYSRVEDYLDRALKGEKVKYEVEVLAKDELSRCSATLVPHFGDGGKVKGVFIFVERIGDQKIIDSHLEDLERFMSHWQANPKGMCHFVGRAVARIAYRNMPDLFFAISTAYFASREICQRIDYIYENCQKKIGGECGKLLTELVEVEEQMEVVCLKDINGTHSGIRVMLVRDTVDEHPTYSLRYFVRRSERLTGYLLACWGTSSGRPTFKRILNPLPPGSQLYEDEHSFWNFRKPVEALEGVIVYPEARGFHDLHESKSVADFIVLASNLFGYEKCIDDNLPLMP